MQGIGGHNQIALMRCLQLEEQWRRAQAAPGIGTIRNFTAASKPILRTGLRLSGWIIDTVLGRAKTVGSIAEYATHCHDADVVSFDVFDTLVYRTVEPPDFLKRRSANYAAQLLAGYGLPVHRDLFLYVRGEEEARLRRRALARGLDTECKLTELVRATMTRLAGVEIAERETARLVNYELDVECHHLRVAPDVIELLSGLRSQGKRVVVVSDTYLESPHLEHVFNQLGINPYFDSIYVSADHGVGKYTGRLFETVLHSEQVRPERMVHLGDNYESDVRGALRTGVRAVFLRDRQRLRMRQEARHRTTLLIAGGATFTPPVGAAQSYPDLEGQEKDLFVIGHKVFGPAFVAFVMGVIDECYRWRVSDIYFLAREGYLFQKIYQILVQNIRRLAALTPISTHYLYASRLSTSLPALEADPRNLQIARFRNPDAGIEESLRAFGLSLENVKEIISGADIESPRAVGQLFADPRFSARVQHLAAHARQTLKAYLIQEGFFAGDEPKAFVDIGWNATIQANLTRAFHRDVDFPTVIGLYFGRRYAHEDDYALSPSSQFLPGIVFDERRLDRAEHAIDRCVEIFEFAASAPHGATVGYCDEGGRVKPALQDAPGRLTREQEILQAGILAYANDFALAYNDHELDIKVLLRQAAAGLHRFICRPTYREVVALRGVQHAIDWGSQALRPLIATDLSLTSVFSPGRLLDSLRYCCWPEGSLCHSGIPGGLFFLSLLRRSLRSRRNLRQAARFCASLLRDKSSRKGAASPLLITKREIVTGDKG